MSGIRCRFGFLPAVLLLIHPFAAIYSKDTEKYAFTSVFENDVSLSDRFYTNGLYFSFQAETSENDPVAYLNPAYWFYAPFSGIVSAESAPSEFQFAAFDQSSSVYTGLDTYTPEHLNKTGISYGDHPYYSRLYAGTSYEISTYRHYFKTSWDAGRSGPGTLSEEGQKEIHFLTGDVSEFPNGWDKQGPSAFSFNTSLDYRLRYYFSRGYGSEAVSLQIHPRIGTANTDLEIGAEYRIATEKDYPDMIQFGNAMYITPGRARFALYIRPSVSYAGYDASLEGNYGDDTKIYKYNKSLSRTAFHYLAYRKSDNFLSEEEFYNRENGFRRLVDQRNTYDFRQDFLIFNSVFYPGVSDNIGEQLLIYELLFKEGKPYEFEGKDRRKESRIAAFYSIAADQPVADAENLYFWRYTLFLKNGESAPEAVRWIAFKKLTDDTDMKTQEKIFIYTALFTGGQLNPLPYGVPPIRLLFNIDAGTSFRLGNTVVTLKFRTVSPRFVRASDISSWHSWWSAGAAFYL